MTGVFDVLCEKKDVRNGGADCAFNGALKEYLDQADRQVNTVILEGFRQILKSRPDTRIIVNYRMAINTDAVSNQIIRYRDIFKLSGKPLLLPYILYGNEKRQERALLVFPYTENSYLYAKGAYYCMSDQGSLFRDVRNEIVAVSPYSSSDLVSCYDQLYEERAGVLQRKLDHHAFTSYDQLKTEALRAGEDLKAEAYDRLPGMKEKTEEIYELVVRWFLLKKLLYVQYMMNKNVLNTVYGGNNRLQRAQAKANADEVQFISYSQLWRMGEEKQNKTEAVEAS